MYLLFDIKFIYNFNLFCLVIMFFILLIAYLTVIKQKLFDSLMLLMVLFFSCGILLITMGLDFLGLLLIIIYVGAILVLFLFVIMLIGEKTYIRVESNPLEIFIFIFSFLYLVFMVSGVAYNFNNVLNQYKIEPLISDHSLIFYWTFLAYHFVQNLVYKIGMALYIKFFIYLILIGLLLLIGLVSCIIISFEKYFVIKQQNLFIQETRNKESSITIYRFL